MSKPKQAPPFFFEGVDILPGKTLQIEIPVSKLPSGGWLSLPVSVVHGSHPGPTIWISAAVHGDELNGIEIVRRILVTIDPATLGGTILAVPIVNVFGVLAESRYLPDRRDLNRSFPGSKNGSLAGRLAHLLTTKIVSRSSFGMDFHTGSGGRSNVAQVRIDLEDKSTRSLALAFAAPLLVHSKVRAGSLRHAAAQQNIPYLLFEGGEAHRFDEHIIQAGHDGAMRVLQTLKMVKGKPKGSSPGYVRPSRAPSVVCDRSFWVRAKFGGIFQPAVALGERISKGDDLALVTDAFNLGRHNIRSPADGIVIGMLQTPIVHAGDALLHIGTLAS